MTGKIYLGLALFRIYKPGPVLKCHCPLWTAGMNSDCDTSTSI